MPPPCAARLLRCGHCNRTGPQLPCASSHTAASWRRSICCISSCPSLPPAVVTCHTVSSRGTSCHIRVCIARADAITSWGRAAHWLCILSCGCVRGGASSASGAAQVCHCNPWRWRVRAAASSGCCRALQHKLQACPSECSGHRPCPEEGCSRGSLTPGSIARSSQADAAFAPVAAHAGICLLWRCATGSAVSPVPLCAGLRAHRLAGWPLAAGSILACATK